MTQKKEPRRNQKKVTLYLYEGDAQRLELLARDLDLSVSQLGRRMISEGLAAYEAQYA